MLSTSTLSKRLLRASFGRRVHHSTMRRAKGVHFARGIHVAIVGSGPAGFYAADELFRSTLKHVKVDMYEKLPTPYGLVRSGVAPDHPEVKAVETVFHALAQAPNFNFVGNVQVGKDVTIEELKKAYQVIILAYGAEDDRKLGIPGEDLQGVHSARSFVEWYNALPDRESPNKGFDLSCSDVAVIGNGNVAVDVARILLRNPEELKKTDIAETALQALRESQVKRISLVGRRGAVQSSFTTGELRELLNIEGSVKCVPDRMLMTTEADEVELKQRANSRKFELLRKTLSVAPPAEDAPGKVLQFHFLRSPVAFIEDANRPGKVGAIRFEHNLLEGPAGSQVAKGTGYFSEMPAQLVFTSIGYSSKPMPGLPFDAKRGIIPNVQGRVEPGVYVCGWIKRGPSGIIGTNKFDAEQTVQTIVSDTSNTSDQALDSQNITSDKDHESIADSPLARIKEILAKRDVKCVDFSEWLKINQEELDRGKPKEKLREKMKRIEEMLQVAHKKL